MDPHAKVWVAGHRGLVGSAITRALEARGFDHYVRTTSADLDLRDQSAVGAFFKLEQPRYVYLAAAKVGGIHANSTYPAEFIYDNLMIESNIIHSAYQTGVEKLLFLGSTCIYPKHAEQPIKEQSLLTGVLEPTNEWYAIAKIAGIKLCQAYREQYGCNFISAMPTNLYGPGDNFDLENSHVMPALIRKFHEAKVSGSDTVTVWGSGTPMREFLHVDDCAAACVHLMENYSGPLVTNIGTGNDVTIRELAETIGEIVGFNGDIVFDASKPDGTPRKVTDISRIRALGWEPSIEFSDGVRATYEWYIANVAA
ncbi:MAG TPA: GDP-L-fucose synthase [Alphaproteobacteria bacterium]|jgi:GDP-L-fucose synthase|nr:GDP-L-fucose synthase [Alphaproteobacteria bacterium]